MEEAEKFWTELYDDLAVTGLTKKQVPWYVNRVEKILSVNVISDFEETLGLLFFQEEMEGNVCLATNNVEMRDGFKIGFTAKDLLFSFYGSCNFSVLTSLKDGPTLYKEWLESIKGNADFFWKLVNNAEGRVSLD